MDKKTKLINIRIAPEEFAQIKNLADEKEMTVSEYVRYMATIFSIKDLKIEIAKRGFSAQQFENDLLQMANSLKQQKKYIEMMERSLNTLTWRMEGQLRQLRAETDIELQKDFARIRILVDSNNIEEEKKSLLNLQRT